MRALLLLGMGWGLLVCGTGCGSSVVTTAGKDGGAGGGAGSMCASPRVLCNTFCVDLATNLDHCGRCSNPCSGTATCANGQCSTGGGSAAGGSAAGGSAAGGSAAGGSAAGGSAAGGSAAGGSAAGGSAAGGSAGGSAAGGSAAGGSAGGSAAGGSAAGGSAAGGSAGGSAGGGSAGGGSAGGGSAGGGSAGGGSAGGGSAAGGSAGGGSTAGGSAAGGSAGGGSAGGGSAAGGSTAGGSAAGGVAPLTIAYATSPNGPAQASIPTGSTIYGRLENAPATGVQACTHPAGSTDCSSPPTNWATFPANGWTYDALASTWRATIAPNSFPPGQYVSFARNTTTGQTATPRTITLTGPSTIYSATLDGPAAASLRVRQTIYGRITGSSAMTQACSEAQGSGSCANLANWATFPANGWTWDGSVWRATIAANSFPPGTYTSYALDVATGSRAAPVTVTLTLTCAWTAIVPGPVPPPTTPCSASNEGAMELANGYTWTCACQ
ncbi:MAG: hypothetical protein JNJ54_09210 [Myxococcaceae bacterium]|nr:hypothetical protein [Myxococcaceae bacterium]